MGRYLLNNKVYDTDKAEEIIKYRKAVKHNGLVFDTYPQYIHYTKHKKDNFSCI